MGLSPLRRPRYPCRHGGRDTLEWAEVPEPLPRYDEIVVRVVAAAPNPLDLTLRDGQ